MVIALYDSGFLCCGKTKSKQRLITVNAVRLSRDNYNVALR